MSRDDFNLPTKTLLRDRVGGLCSNPGCRAATLGAALDPADTTSIGVAAHIHAAAPGGPRYLEVMTPEARSAASNGIWLCQSCSRLVDRDVNRYPAATLFEWKDVAEAHAMRSIGQRPPSNQDAQDQMIMAFSRVPVSFVPTAIDNVHHATAEVLKRLDARIDVKTSYDHRGPVITFLPREPVPMRFIVGQASRDEWKRQIRALVEHGEVANLPGDDLRIVGSPLFDHTFTPETLAGGKLIFTPRGRAAVAKLSLIDPETKSIFQVDDLRGFITQGTQSFKFSGTACGELLSLTFKMPLTAVLHSEGDFTIGVDFDLWVGRAVGQLPYFDKLRQLYSKILDGWVVDVKLEVDGNYLFGAKMNVPVDSDYFRAAHVILEYANRVRILASKVGKSVTFDLEPPFSADDHMRLAEVVDILTGQDPITSDCVNEMSMSLEASENLDNIRHLKEQTVPHRLVHKAEPDEPLLLYGQPVELPSLIHTLEGVVPHIERELQDIQPGEPVPVVWRPAPGFKFSRRFDDGAFDFELQEPDDDEKPENVSAS